jgi:hypothetical protein
MNRYPGDLLRSAPRSLTLAAMLAPSDCSLGKPSLAVEAAS